MGVHASLAELLELREFLAAFRVRFRPWKVRKPWSAIPRGC
jgi:hypothetical protein